MKGLTILSVATASLATSVAAQRSTVLYEFAPSTGQYTCGASIFDPNLSDLSRPCGSSVERACPMAIDSAGAANVLCEQVFRIGMPSAQGGIDTSIYARVQHVDSSLAPNTFAISQRAVHELCHNVCAEDTTTCINSTVRPPSESCAAVAPDTMSAEGVVTPGSAAKFATALQLPYQCASAHCSGDENDPGDIPDASVAVIPVMYEDRTEGGAASCIADLLTETQLVDPQDTCGDALNPCVASFRSFLNFAAECDKCYRFTVLRNQIDGALCASGSCPAYEEDMHVMMVDDATSKTPTHDYIIGLPHAGFKKACPFQCAADAAKAAGVPTLCASDAAECVHGVMDPGSDITVGDFTYNPLGSASSYGAMITAPVEVPCSVEPTPGIPPMPTTTGAQSTGQTSGAASTAVSASLSLALAAGAIYVM